MGDHVAKAEDSIAGIARSLPWINLVGVAACLTDYALEVRPWAFETLVIWTVLTNGGFLLLQWLELKSASARDTMAAAEKADQEAERDARTERRWR